LISIKGIGMDCGHAMNQPQAHAASTANNDAGAPPAVKGYVALSPVG
jgi:hypothetical protein